MMTMPLKLNSRIFAFALSLSGLVVAQGCGEGESSGELDDGSAEAEFRSFIGGSDLLTSQSCDIQQQDCPTGEKCTLVSEDQGESWGGKCVPLNGELDAGEACEVPTGTQGHTGEDACGEGLACRRLEGDDGICSSFCGEDVGGAECGPFEVCVSDGALDVCVPTNCDPTLADPCGDPEDLRCVPFYGPGGGFHCARATGDLPLGSACQEDTDCVTASSCVIPFYNPVNGPSNATPTCRNYCDTTIGDGDCPTGQECQKYFDDYLLPAYPSIGKCVVPEDSQGPAGPSCEGHCGGSSDGCWCDYWCDYYGDCCADKSEQCEG